MGAVVNYSRMNSVKLSQFDLCGTFRLTKAEVTGIESLVKRLGEDEFLSRNSAYYPFKPKSLAGAAFEYAQLNELLPMSGKPAFVVCEKMHSLATRVVNSIQQTNKIHLFQDGVHFDTVAQKCAQECADNLVRLINNQPAIKTVTQLSDETRLNPDQLLDKSVIFADNQKQLYMCANALPTAVEHLITPGRGSSKLGTLVQAVRQHKGLKPLGFTQIYYSYYINQQYGKIFPKALKQLPTKLLVMDDFIFRGVTLTRIKKELTAQGHQVTNGAITTSFFSNLLDYSGVPKSVFKTRAWTKYIDIIPNQFDNPSSNQEELRSALQWSTWELPHVLPKLRGNDPRHTADYCAMQKAELLANKCGADLYQASAKISPAAVQYNQAVRAQIEKYDAEYQATLTR